MKIILSFGFDWEFFAVLPALNINRHTGTVEFEWMVFGVYLDFISSTPAERW